MTIVIHDLRLINFFNTFGEDTRLIRRLATLLVGLCFVAGAQDPIGTLEGQIADPAAALVANAEVRVQNAQTGLTRTVLSSRQGTFHFADLPVGEYRLSVTAKGFAPYCLDLEEMSYLEAFRLGRRSWPICWFKENSVFSVRRHFGGACQRGRHCSTKSSIQGNPPGRRIPDRDNAGTSLLLGFPAS